MERPSWVREIELAGDASYRRYTRLIAATGATVIRVTYPADRAEALVRDCEVLAWLSERGLRVPKRLWPQREPGRVYLEDFGEEDAEKALRQSDPRERGERVRGLVSPLVALSAMTIDDLPPWNTPLGAQRLREELAAFEEWFLSRFLETALRPAVGGWLDELAATVGRHPLRVCHRDYHLNNLFFLADGQVGVIDAQDLLVGPDTYDAVSLVGERAFPDLLGEEEARAWLELWAETTGAAIGWERRALEAGLQRALKVLGTFARLDLNGRPGYRKWMGPLAQRVAPALRALAAPPELEDTLLQFGVGGSHVW